MLTDGHAMEPGRQTPQTLALLVKARADELGFSAVGIASAAGPLEPEFSRYRDALAEGLHGPIAYLADNVAARRQLDDDSILAGARSVIVVAVRYDRPDDERVAPLARGIARYARGRDYHNHLRKKLRTLARFVRTLAPSVEARPMSDTAPVLEKAWAARAGVGFLGKNGVVITPGEGSFTLLGEVVTTLALAPDIAMDERCGRCTLCIDACPTGALVRPFVLDAGKCVATTTIELRGPVPEPLRLATSEHLFGCDICQDVCPYNAKRRALPPLADRYLPHERWSTLTLDELARIGMDDGPDFEAIVESSPLRRSGPEGLARNACLALGREGRKESAPLLRDIGERHPSEVVRDAARWALSRIAR